MTSVEKLWKFRYREQISFAFGDNFLVLGLDNTLICLNSKGVMWSKEMQVTFYRDPYGDVAITALDADRFHVAAGTNFMDGKAYLFTKDGELKWKHQFATIASLGWRPEDVTAVRLNNSFVAVGTEFMNEYIHLYTTDRKRVFQKRVRGRVEDLSFIGDKLVVGTDSHLYVFDMGGREERVEIPVNRVEVTDDRIIVLNDHGVVAYELYMGEEDGFMVKGKSGYAVNSVEDDNVDNRPRKLKRRWGIGLKKPLSCFTGEDLLLASENLLSCVSRDGEVKWRITLDKPVECLFYDWISGKIYIGMDRELRILLNGLGDGVGGTKEYVDYVERMDTTHLDGRPIGIGRLGDIVAVVCEQYERDDILVYLCR